MTAVEVAERRARWRALGFLFLAVLTCAVMIVVRTGRGSDFIQGLWLGLLLGCAFALSPVKRWLRPNSAVVRLLEDEGTRENRRLSCTIGFWAAIALALFFQGLAHFNPGIGAEEVGQLVATAGIVCAITAFGILELRAAR
jgi:drug/metabolite transporter (DMT)-like permease